METPLIRRYVLDNLNNELIHLEHAVGSKRLPWPTRFWASVRDRIGRKRRPNLEDVPHDPAILHKRPSILIDITPTARAPGSRGGIPRVCRELAKAAVETGLALPVEMENGQLISYFRDPALTGPIEVGPADIFLIVDIFWYFLEEYDRAVTEVRARGGKVAIVIHDVFPLIFPTLFPEEVPRLYKSGLTLLMPKACHCLSVSKSSRIETQRHLEDMALASHLRFGHFLLGVAKDRITHGHVRPHVSGLFSVRPVFLSVGKLEPRKGYSVAIDACEFAWSEGVDFVYLMVGTFGWRAKALKARIENHAEFDRRLFIVDDLSDAELAFVYSRCHSLIHAAICEGFGLPVIEASLHGAPVIASDLPVFREIAGTQFTLFPVADAWALARAIASHAQSPACPAAFEINDWGESMRQLAACLAA
jgi:glycosyltransferase involved in cell wall biosynthesis